MFGFGRSIDTTFSELQSYLACHGFSKMENGILYCSYICFHVQCEKVEEEEIINTKYLLIKGRRSLGITRHDILKGLSTQC